MAVSWKQKLFYFFPVLFCFCLPFGSRISSLLIALWFLASFLNIDWQKIRQGLRTPGLLLLFLFFLLTGISAMLSSNKEEAAFGIEVKLSFVFFPYLLFCFSWPIEILKRCIVSFVSGCFFACVFLILRAFYFSMNGHPEYFFYTFFSLFIHASYFAMYLVLCIVIVVLFYKQWFSTQKTVLISSYFFIAVFVATIFLCSSKLGIISFFICIPLLILYKWRSRLSLQKGLILFAGLAALVVVLFLLFPGSFGRLNSLTSVPATIDRTSAESTKVRILIWQQALLLIKENFLFGTGVGDDNDALYAAYARQGMTGALAHKLNAHNQFFQTFIALGISGFFVLILVTFGQLVRAVLKKNFLLFIFSLLIILNFLVESMLQTAAGVLFFTFFFCMFNVVNEKKLLGD